MAKILQQNLFSWQDVDAKSDLERLRLVLDYLPDEKLMQKLERMRGQGRDDYPVRAVWNSIIAGIVYQHVSIESLRRELLRNGELRDMCGFDPIKGADAVPPSWVYSRFLKNLFKCEEEIKEMFNMLVEMLVELLPDFGEKLAVDSKAVDSAGKPTKKEEGDGRRDTDADWGRKEYKGKREDGTYWEKIVKWFGYKIHLLVDSKYELPIGYKVTRASASDSAELLPLVSDCAKRHPEVIKRANELCADKGYDSEDNNRILYDDYEIKPVIDIRNMWKDRDETHPLYSNKVDNIIYNYCGRVFCFCCKTGKQREMAFKGFEAKRKALKYVCPVYAYGIECEGMNECYGKGKRIVRIPLKTDRRIFTPIARSSYRWERAYKSRTAVERVNSRLDGSFGFERHFIHGLPKMRVRAGVSFIVMLTIAVGRIKEKQKFHCCVAQSSIKGKKSIKIGDFGINKEEVYLNNGIFVFF